MTHEEIQELLPAHALGALSPDERTQIEAHLTSCASCQEELEAFRDVTAALAGAGTVDPPATLRAALLREILPARANVITLPRTRVVAFGLAAAALIIVLLGSTVTLNRRLADLSSHLNAQEQVLALLAGPDARSVALRGSIPASVRFVFDPTRQEGALIVSDLRDPGDEFVYQLWLVAGQTPQSAGVFRPVAGRSIILPVRAQFGRYQAVAISVERGPRGSSRPTTTPILVGTI